MTTIETDQQTSPVDERRAEAQTTAVSGWFDDPQGLHRLRYFDGDLWTKHVTHFGPSPCETCR